MRRLLSITFLLLLVLPIFTPVVAQQQDDLPACCRRGGVHHCMSMSGMLSSQPGVRMRCPVFPRPASIVTAGVWTVLPLSAATYTLTALPGIVGQAEAGHRISFGRARQKRGPPAQNT